MMIMVTRLRGGVTFEYEGKPYKVLEYKHTHMSRGGGTVRVKVRNLRDGRLGSFTFKSTESVQEIEVEKKELQYLYADENGYYFMDPVTFEQVRLSKELVGERGVFLREGEKVWVLFWEERPLDLDLPPKVVMKVVECAPGEKGDSASNVYKDAVVEGGLKVRVPLFINVGDKIRVDTRDGKYVERA